ncbi:MAG TPA: hypothetical protein VET24_13650 [Actinomycetota bacterium]|nr:hypothetical protein [Actinomycetota bacterium]
MRGDRVEVLVDVGNATRSFEIVATKAGRRVEVTIARGTVEVAEVTRSGQPVRSARFMATRVVAVVEHPSDSPGDPEPRQPRRPPPENQASLGF